MSLLFKEMKEEDLNIGINSLINDSTPKPSFFFLVNMSAIMATLGLLLNNVSIIIGSMLIAPLLSPILALTLGIEIRDRKLTARSIKIVIKSILFILALAFMTSFMFSNFAVFYGGETSLFNSEILSRTEMNIIYLAVAIIAGMTTAFARMKPELNDSLPGTAIAIALVPPLAVVGIGLRFLNKTLITQASFMFLLNIIGIILGAYLIFAQLGVRRKKNVAKRATENADKKLKKMKEEYEEEKIEEKIEDLKDELGLEEVKKPRDKETKN